MVRLVYTGFEARVVEVWIRGDNRGEKSKRAVVEDKSGPSLIVDDFNAVGVDAAAGL